MAAKKPRTAAQQAATARMLAARAPAHRTETVVANESGTAVRPRDPRGGLVAHVRAHTPVEFDRAALGAMWSGFLDAAQGVHGRIDTSDLYPSTDDETPQAVALRREYAQEREMGRQLWAVAGKALAHHKVDAGAWKRFYDAAMAMARVEAGQWAAVSGGKGDGGFASPFDRAAGARVTDRFGVARGAGRIHRGVDLAVPAGTDVRAPQRARVDSAWTEDEGGVCLRLALEAPDGSFAGDNTLGDDTGIYWTVCHLSDVLVAKGDVVERGQVVARSGNTGRSSGPHLHIMTELFTDAPWSIDTKDKRTLLDPEDLYGGEAALTGEAEGQVMPLAVIDAAQMDAKNPERVVNRGTVVVGEGGELLWSGGKALARVKSLLRVEWDGQRFGGGSSGGAGAGSGTGAGGFGGPALPSPDAVRQQARQQGAQAWRAVREVGGRVVEVLLDPDTHRVAVRTLGRVGQVAGGAVAAGATVYTAAAPVLVTLGGALQSVPYVGTVLGGISAALGAAAPVAGPILGVLGSGVSAVGGALGSDKAPPPPQLPPLGQGGNVISL